MIKWILIIVLSNGVGGASSNAIEFDDHDACVTALHQMGSNLKETGRNYGLQCVAKKSSPPTKASKP